MSNRRTVIISAIEDDLIVRYINEDELQVLEKFKKLSGNFKKAILGMIELFIEYQEKYKRRV